MQPATTLVGFLVVLGVSGCLLPGRKDQGGSGNAGFFKDYSLLKEATPVRMAYLDPTVDFKSFRSVRILDFENYTGHSVDPQALILAADALTTELQALPPIRRPFEIIDRSPRAASAWVDLLLESALTRYDVAKNTSSLTRLKDQVIVTIECRLIDNKTGALVALIQHRTKENIPEIGYENPVRQALQRLGRDVAQWLADPQAKGSDQKEPDSSEKNRL